ncbi:MAG: dephospho-CoA kinase, partial [Treponema sp.]|nr:dephospho-CoA kinase [Treponema sp.]
MSTTKRPIEGRDEYAPRSGDSQRPLLAGLTGLYCAGKNHVAALLEQRGLPVLDLDRLGRRVIDGEARDAILRRFGPAVSGGEGRVDRRLLGRRVFGRPEELAALEAIVHPAVNRLTVEWIAGFSAPQNAGPENAGTPGNAGNPRTVLVINAALLHKSSVRDQLDVLIVVHAPWPVRLLRARRRDRLPLGELIRRFRSQRDFPQLFSSPSDRYSIANSGFPGSRRRLEKHVDEILEGLHHGKEKAAFGGCHGGGISG